MKNTVFPSLALVLAACEFVDIDDLPSNGDLVKQSLGDITIDDTGLSGGLNIEIPDNAVSGIIDCGPFGDDVLGTLYGLTDPDGATAYDYNNPMDTPFRAGVLDDHIPTLIPMSPDLDIAAGTWLATYYIGAANVNVPCNATWRTSPPANKATLNLDLTFVGLTDLDASTAESDADFQAAMDEMSNIWSSNLNMGDVRFQDFDGNVDRFAVIDITDTADPYAEFNDLLRSSDPGRDQTVNIFFVQEIADFEGATIYGLAGGPPGAAAVHGTSKSGIVVSTADLRSDPTFLGRAIAHELGHFLGLNHTTEKDASSFDALSDTSECDMSNDANGNGTMNSTECAGIDAENLMFWTASGADLSSDQGWVVVRNPAVE